MCMRSLPPHGREIEEGNILFEDVKLMPPIAFPFETCERNSYDTR